MARTFPDLPIVCCHGFYPRVADMFAVAFRNENVFVSPDMYMFSPGGRLYIEAANGFLQDQYLFGTSYPFRAMAQSVEDLGSIGLAERVSTRCAEGPHGGCSGCRRPRLDPPRSRCAVSNSRYMAMALALAERGLGNVWPNPAVGCVLVRDGRVVGRGWTQPGGRPHAESEAIGRAGEAARGSTAYVTLEPLRPSRPNPALHRSDAVGGDRACGGGGGRSRPSRQRTRHRTVACGRNGGRGRLPGSGGPPAERRLLRPDLQTAAVRGAQARVECQRPDRHGCGQQPVDHQSAARAEGHRLRLLHDAILMSSGKLWPTLPCSVAVSQG